MYVYDWLKHVWLKILEKYVWKSLFLISLLACMLIAGNFKEWTPSEVFFRDFI